MFIRWIYPNIDKKEYVNGIALVSEDFGAEPLKNYIPDNGFSICDFLNTAVQLADDLIEIHTNNFIHKNLHYENIVMNPETGWAKIIDFKKASNAKQEVIDSPVIRNKPETGRPLSPPSKRAE